jgi:aerobic carbon-monoxide dehydrogenase medium subunit
MDTCSSDSPNRGESEWLRPNSLVEAARMASEPSAIVVAGGCEVAVILRAKAFRPSRLIVLSAITGMDRLSAHPKIGLSIGPLVRMDAIANHLWVAKRWAALHEAVEQVQPPQVRHMATVVGNVCCGRPDYDLTPSLMALGATARAALPNGNVISFKLDELYGGNGQFALARGTIVQEIYIQPPSPDAGSAFRKITVADRAVSAAAYVALSADANSIEHATLVLGGSLPAPLHISAAESLLRGAPAKTASYEQAGRAAAESLRMLDTHPANRELWIRMAVVLARDALEQAASRARSKHNPFEDAQSML